MLERLIELGRQKIGPFKLAVGDKLRVTYDVRDERGGITNTLVETTLCEEQTMTVDEAILFSGEYEGRRALGGMVLEQKQ